MGTNFYMTIEACESCGRGDRIHIGKSSAGWRFAIPDNLGTWEDFKATIRNPLHTIEDEYGGVWNPERLIQLIENKAKDPRARRDSERSTDGPVDILEAGFR